jgi:hypothetical protein
MQRFVFLIVLVVFSFAALFSRAPNRPLFFAAFSFGGLNIAISTDPSPTSPKTCKLYGFHLSVGSSSPEHLGVVPDFSTCYDNHFDPFGTTACESKFSLSDFSEPQTRFTELADVVAGILRNSAMRFVNPGRSYTPRNTSFAMNCDYRARKRFAWRPFRFYSDTSWFDSDTNCFQDKNTTNLAGRNPFALCRYSKSLELK